MTLRETVSSSRFARIAALPTRARAVSRHVSKETVQASKWLVKSREHHNYTYHLTARNVTHLSWWVVAVTGSDIADCRFWVHEALNDTELTDHVQKQTRLSSRRGLADLDVRIGRRAGWYAVIRALRPEHVVETGTDKGLGSVVIAAALLRNGTGRLTTMDINPAAGYLVSGRYADVSTVLIGDSLSSIRGLDREVDLFVHDSDHHAEHEAQELAAIAPKLTSRSRVLSDNAHAADSLVRWAESTGRSFLYFQERPDGHWYPGAGIGAAWLPTHD